MAKSSGFGSILTLGAVAVGGYFAWPYISGFLQGLTPAAAPAAPAPPPIPAAPTGGVIQPANPPAAPICGPGQALNVSSGACVAVPTSSNAPLALDPCGSVSPAALAFMLQLSGAGIDPATNPLTAGFGVPAACVASYTAQALLRKQSLQLAGINVSGMGALSPPSFRPFATMTRANRRNYRRRAA